MNIIEFEPIGRRGECPEGESLLDAAGRLDVDIVRLCNGVGVCGRCKVQIITGEVSPITAKEKEILTVKESGRNYRLACLTRPLGNVKVHVPSESLTAPQRTQVEGLELDITPEPAFESVRVELTPPTVEKQAADETSLMRALNRTDDGTLSFDLEALRAMPPLLRAENWRVCAAVRNGEVIAIESASARWCGLAVDIGTTKIAVYLVDMDSGKTLASRGLMNPQISCGEDVVSRIYFASRSMENAGKLQALLVEALNEAILSLCGEAGIDRRVIVDAVIVGNTAIHHLFLKIPVSQLGLAPYVPALQSSIDVKARDLGLEIAPGAYVHLPPNIAGYVGADHVAMIICTSLAEASGVTLAIDIGTNTEICLNNRGEMASVSCASGPAFEGAHIRHGMRAAPGAIEHVRISGDQLTIQTIGGEPPAGICGSGLLDVAAQMKLNGVIDSTGKILDHPGVRVREDGVKEFVIAERPGKDDITISQKDIRELQLAKAAIRLGIGALVEEMNITESDIDEVIIAGAFGTFIDVESAIVIGMLPPLPRERFRQVGNAAGTGARLALVSVNERRKASSMAARVRYVELAAISDFNQKFATASAMKEL